MASMLSARSPTCTPCAAAALPASGRAPAAARVHSSSRRACALPKRCAVVAASSSNGSMSHTSSPLRPGETAEQAAARRAKESARVGERTKYVTSRAELDAAFALVADDTVVILTVQSDSECNLGDDPAAQAATWATPQDNATRMAECTSLKDSLQRVAREAENVEFVELEGDASQEARLLASELGVKTFPTVQFWKSGRLLWQYAGASAANAQLGEGVLFFAGQGVADYVTEIQDKDTLGAFLQSCSAPQTAVRGMTLSAPCEQQLAVVDVSLAADCPACVHVFPAVLALAKNTAGAIRWGRLLGDASPEAGALMKSLNVTSVPTFIMLHNDKEVGRYVGSDRGKLMAAVLDATAATGLTLPEAPTRKRPSVAEAKRIAAEARARDKAMGRKSGW